MKTFVEFRSSKFPPYEGEEEEINPGLWGKRLAEYISQKLLEKDIKTDELLEPVAGEDITPLVIEQTGELFGN
jgi:hypothetical protein